MSMKTRLTLTIVLALVALFMLPALSFAASRPASDDRTTASYAFSGHITDGPNKNTPLVGGLTLSSASSGNFTGYFYTPGGTRISVGGEVEGENIEIKFLLPRGVIIKGVGELNGADNEFVGTFKAFDANDKQIENGIWSALSVPHPNDVLALAFVGQTGQGPDKDIQYSGALVLEDKTLKGTLNLPDGRIVTVTAVIKGNGEITVTFKLDDDKEIIGKGITRDFGNSIKGYQGTYEGPKTEDKGSWATVFFHF